ncbi:MAG: extracellular matrix regulatory protein [Bacillota bacterium]|nr:extracellular matrix regulatory protein [Bacillota bacterium]
MDEELIQLFLHIGGQVSVAVRDLVAMLDMEIVKKSPLTAEFLSRVREDRGVLSVDGQEPRCAVITPSAVYLSPISLPTLRRRLEAAYGAVEDEGPGRNSARHET